MNAVVLSRRASGESQAMGCVLAKLHHDAPAVFGTPTVGLETLQVIHRPYSEIARVRVQGGAVDTEVFVKVARLRSEAPGEIEFMRRRVAADHAVTKLVHESMPRSPGLGTIRPVACYPDLLTIVTERAPGETLLVAAERSVRRWSSSRDHDLNQAMVHLGRWIAGFQRSPAPIACASRAYLREYLDVRLRRLVDSDRTRFSATDRDDVLRAFDAQVRRLSENDLQLVPIHADFALGNVLVDRDRVCVLDFAMSTTGTRFDDVAQMHLQLGLLAQKPHFSRSKVASLQRALLRGFSNEPIEGSPLFRLITLQHVACHYLGLAERPASLASQAYNAWVARSHQIWLRRFAAEA